MISRLLLPSSCVRLATYSCVRRSRRIRARQIMYSARLASRFPPRLRRCRTTLPEEASMGETPHRLAKEASLLNLWGLSPATINSVAAWSGRQAFAGQCFADSYEIDLATRVATRQLNRKASPWVWGRPPKSPRHRRRTFVYHL